jgi:large subunit ribosomal protein L14
MIQRRTMLNVADNSGALLLQCIGIVKKGNARYAEIGDIIVCSVKKAEPRRQIGVGDVVKAVVVRQKKPYRRKDGSYIRFFENAAVILGTGNEPLGNRIFGPIPREIKEKGFTKIANLAEELV